MVEEDNVGYFVKAKYKDCILLPEDARWFNIPRREKGSFGRSSVWYPDKEGKKEFIGDVFNYIQQQSRVQRKVRKYVGRFARQPNVEKRKEVEEAAMRAAMHYYQDLGYKIKDISRKYLGWDFYATKDEIELKVEAKGLSGDSITVQLTPNEYKQLKANLEAYRIAVLINALAKDIDLRIFAFNEERNKWQDQYGFCLELEESVSATMYED